jgi:hypothetical protein
VSSVSTTASGEGSGLKARFYTHSRSNSRSRASISSERTDSPVGDKFTLYREDQRVTLRAYIRLLLKNQQVAESKTLKHFLTDSPVTMNGEERFDEDRRREMDEARVQEQVKFFEIAQQRARELDVYMEGFRRDIVESSMGPRAYNARPRANAHP